MKRVLPTAADNGPTSYEGYRCLGGVVEHGVAFVTLDHGPINLLDTPMIRDLDRVGRQLENDSNVRVVVLQSANPDFFIAHADLHLIG
jgi:enoyl-CoA hydratase/carnithine racemase